MRVLSWNVNHRAARRRIPAWIAGGIGAHNPDVVILTEYVVGPDHDRLLADLHALDLAHVSVSDRVSRQNQLLIATREPHRRGETVAPTDHPAIPPNALHVVLADSGLHVVGFRMPAFEGKERPLKRLTWEWLVRVAGDLLDKPAVIAGDFNTAVGDPVSTCGDCMDALTNEGWQLMHPPTGYSWQHSKSGTGRKIDHAFLSPALAPVRAEYNWNFHELSPDAASGKVGVPDHAMVIADFK